jgi:hypothetical protein
MYRPGSLLPIFKYGARFFLLKTLATGLQLEIEPLVFPQISRDFWQRSLTLQFKLIGAELGKVMPGATPPATLDRLAPPTRTMKEATTSRPTSRSKLRSVRW